MFFCRIKVSHLHVSFDLRQGILLNVSQFAVFCGYFVVLIYRNPEYTHSRFWSPISDSSVGSTQVRVGIGLQKNCWAALLYSFFSEISVDDDSS